MLMDDGQPLALDERRGGALQLVAGDLDAPRIGSRRA